MKQYITGMHDEYLTEMIHPIMGNSYHQSVILSVIISTGCISFQNIGEDRTVEMYFIGF